MPYWRTIIVFFSFVAGVGVLGFYAYPVLQDTTLLKEQLVETRKTKDELDTEVTRLRAYLEEAEVITAEDRERVELALPETPEILKLMLDLETLALRNGLLMTGLSVDAVHATETGEAQRGIATASMSLHGNYLALNNYLDDIRRDVRILNIESVSFMPEEGNIESLVAHVRIMAYYVTL